MSQTSQLPISPRSGVIDVVDVHVGGDLHRIVLDGIVELPGESVLEKMTHLRDNADGLRQILLEEPRGGHPSLYADLVVEPKNPKADAAFIIMELMGYPLISGTNTMSTAIALLEMGRLPMVEGPNSLVLEAPGGLIDVDAYCENGKVKSVAYKANTPSYMAARDLVLDMPGRGKIKFDLIWTGAFYPVVNASELGFKLIREDEASLVEFARDFIPMIREHHHPVHPVFGDEVPLSFVVFAGEPDKVAEGEWERRICCYEYPRNSVCRAPAGVPSTAVLVQLVEQGKLSVGDALRTISIFDTDLLANVVSVDPYHGRNGVTVTVTGRGWITTRSQIIVDLSDPLTPRDGLDGVLER
ncbi:proline racemase family protein [Ensifer sp. BR816]|uniref:proline racemase family protein n=1 Tax=Rhizobium sp. (strain BR816) TaxID=1057002 RepID=UPI000A01D0F3|nr:proline racemase family protein [Ensifer sp. BR816]